MFFEEKITVTSILVFSYEFKKTKVFLSPEDLITLLPSALAAG